MKKFWIFILGVITAIVGFFIFTDKTPTADTPPINNEQQQPGDNTGDDNTGDVTPDDPSNVGGTETQYTTNTFNFDNIRNISLFKFDTNSDAFVSIDISNGLEWTQLIVGERYNIDLEVTSGFAVTEVVYNNDSIYSGYHTEYNSILSVYFTVVENGIFQVITQPVNSDSEIQYTTNTFYLNDSQVEGLEYYLNDIWSTVDISNGLDNSSLVVGVMHSINVRANEGFALTSLIYNGETIWSGYDTYILTSFTAVENGTLEVTTCEKRQSFNVDEIEIICSFEDFSATYYSVETGEIVNTLEVGNSYRIELNLNDPDYVFVSFYGNCTSDVDCSYTSSTSITFEVNGDQLPIFRAYVCHNTYKTTVEVEPLEYIDSWSVSNMAGHQVENVWLGETYSLEFTVTPGFEINSYMIIQDGNVLSSSTFEAPFSGTTSISFSISGISSPIIFCFDGNMVE